MTLDARPIRLSAEGVRVALRVTPKASRAVIEGVEHRPGAGPQLRVRVREAPDKGKANAAVLALLAKTWALPVSTLSLVSGEAGRDKIVLVRGEGEALAAQITAWLERQAF